MRAALANLLIDVACECWVAFQPALQGVQLHHQHQQKQQQQSRASPACWAAAAASAAGPPSARLQEPARNGAGSSTFWRPPALSC